VHCGAIPEELLESEMFGHERGAFTGAIASRVGRFKLADGGTIFLDEIGEMSPKLQVKLLRVLEDGRFEPVGSVGTQQVDVRIIAATNRTLEQAVAAKQFREDLFYRLRVVPIEMPPLRRRREDIPLIVEHTLDALAAKGHAALPGRADRDGSALPVQLAGQRPRAPKPARAARRARESRPSDRGARSPAASRRAARPRPRLAVDAVAVRRRRNRLLS
jgi:DNA-binding NtrC family response regulator